MKQIYDVIVLGGGPAGYAAALYAVRAGLSTLVIEKMSPGGQMATTDMIDNYPGFHEGIDGFTLGIQMQQGAERFGAVTVYDEVIALMLTEQIKTVRTNGTDYFAKAVIVAMGAAPKELGLAGEKELAGNGVHYCAHCDGRFYKDKTVVVVGGGNSAAADALHLSKLCKKVILVHRRDSLRATKIYHDPLLQADIVEFLWNSRITSFVQNEKLQGVQVEHIPDGESKQILCDGVFVAIGRKAETALLAGQVMLDSHGYIVADESTRTNLPGVFAAGDIRTKPLRQVVTAAADGAVAASMAAEYLWKLEM